MATELLMEINQDERERAIMMSRKMYETDRFNELQMAIDRGVAKGTQKMLSLIKNGHSPEEAMKMANMS
jgi:hypothetical protein